MSERAVLPELEHLLVRAARRRAAPRANRRRWILAVAAAGMLLAGGAAAAATHVFLASGETAGGTFTIESKRVPVGRAAPGSICLQLRFSGRGTAYGCGSRPSRSQPFGLVIADPLDGGDERVVYGLVSEAVARVKLRSAVDSEIEAVTEPNEELWGRFFSMVAPNDGTLQLIGYGAGGQILARLGRIGSTSAPLRSKAEAVRRGDPAGFAPGVSAPQSYMYKGELIDPALSGRLGLACLQERAVFRCYDSEEEAEAAHPQRP
jgi:hypothetical protein